MSQLRDLGGLAKGRTDAVGVAFAVNGIVEFASVRVGGNRIDETIIFHPLSRDHIKQIIEILVVDVAKRLADKGISFILTPEAKEFLCDRGYDPQYGARPLKRAIQKYLDDPLAEEILRGQYAGDLDLLIGADPDSDKLTFKFNTHRSTPERETVG